MRMLMNNRIIVTFVMEVQHLLAVWWVLVVTFLPVLLLFLRGLFDFGVLSWRPGAQRVEVVF